MRPDQLDTLRRLDKALKHLWKCGRSECDGLPHAGAPHKHARFGQLPPDGDWWAWFYMAGRGAGKTRSGGEYVKDRMLKVPYTRVAIIERDRQTARDVTIEGESGLLGQFDGQGSIPWNRVADWNRSMGELYLKNGSMAKLFGTDTQKDAEKLRGYQCFVAGTRIETVRGGVPIERLAPGTLVWTRLGLRPIRAVSSREAPVIHSGALGLTGTPSHLVWTENRGWVPMSSIHACDTIVAWTGEQTSEGTGTGSALTESTHPYGEASGSGNRLMAPSLRGGTSTIWTGTPAMTPSRTSSRSPRMNTCACTQGSHEITSAESAANCIPVPAGAVPRIALPASERLFVPNAAARMLSGLSAKSSVSSAAAYFEPGQGPCAQCGASTFGATHAGVQTVYNLEVDDVPEYFANGVLVHNCHVAWFEELGTQRFGDVAWKMLEFALRLGDDPRIVITSTPRNIPIIRKLVDDPDVVVTRGRTFDNADNIPAKTLQRLKSQHEGTSLGRQELDGELLADSPGALWSTQLIQNIEQAPCAMDRIVVAVDPAGTNKPTSDLTGIVVVGLGEDGRGYVLRDASDRYSPEQWRAKVLSLYREFEADAVVGEVNFGADLVAANLRSIPREERPPFVPVNASRGKKQRFEPVVGLYEQSRIFHVGSHPELEDQMTQWVPPGQFDDEGDPIPESKESPDRVDAMAWGITNLMLTPRKKRGGMSMGEV